jgi:site-specific DNA-methyltransferase (adenine-specific)/modification methylase
VIHREEIIGDCRLILGDCREVLPTLGPVDAVVTDPPYGIGETNAKNLSRGTSSAKWKRDKPTDYGAFEWDQTTVQSDLMAAVLAAGRWQIVFGGNYYPCPPASCWLVWDKLNGDSDFADCELAWTNLPKAVRRIRYLWNGFAIASGEERGDHPTQKPVGVMAWALNQLPCGTQTILDPFMGSGTTGVACALAGLTFTGIEREQRYFDAACRRIEEAYKQPRLFAEPVAKPIQPDIFAEGKAA